MASLWASPPLNVPRPLARPLAQDREQRLDALEHLSPVGGIAVTVAALLALLGGRRAGRWQR